MNESPHIPPSSDPILLAHDSLDKPAPSIPTLSLAQIYSLIGGFSLFHCLATPLLILTSVSGGLFIGSLAYLELYPRYLCTDSAHATEYECKPALFCSSTEDIQHRVD